LRGDHVAIGAKLGGHQFRCVFRRIENLRQNGRFAFFVGSAEIKMVSFFAAGAGFKQPVVDGSELGKLPRRCDGTHSKVSLGVIRGDLLGRQLYGRLGHDKPPEVMATAGTVSAGRPAGVQPGNRRKTYVPLARAEAPG
jgi:hypothetical protein